MSNKSEPPKGRPEKEIDLTEVEKLYSIHATDAEVADFLRVSESTLLRRKRCRKILTIPYDGRNEGYQGTFADVVRRGKSMAKLSVRRGLYRQMMNGGSGATAVAIFLAKNVLGYKDVVANEITGANGGPLQHEDVSKLSESEIDAEIARLLRKTGIGDEIGRPQEADDTSTGQGTDPGDTEPTGGS